MNGLQDKTCENVKGFAETHGYDFRNYWSGAIYFTIKNIKKVIKEEYKEWKKED